MPLLFFLLASCREKQSGSSEASLAAVANLPDDSSRTEAAVARVRPDLEKSLAAKNLHLGDPVFLRAFKQERELELWIQRRNSGKYELFRTWKIAAASGKLGPKLAEGDGQVPEGFYTVSRSAMKPDSKFHLAFNIGFPNDFDRYHNRTGTFLMIHGGTVSAGCLAMTDEKIEEIYTLCDAALRNGPSFFHVHIFPFRMTTGRMKASANHEWRHFWENLKQGYDFFEREHMPPEIIHQAGRYLVKPPP